MCLSPIRIRNKSLSFGYDNYQKLFMEVPCGKCAECVELMRSQWYLRNYWQCRLSYDTNGWILFDTLTYRDEDLPHLLDFLPGQYTSDLLEDINYPCFSFVDIRNFMKRLRTNLTRAGYDVKNCLKYFLAAEYGTHDGFTHRPHYHVLFYYIPQGEKYLDPIDFSTMIDVAWTHGRTDGVPYKGESYVREKNIFGQNYSKNSDLNLRAVACYVAKYVTKDSTFQSTIDARIEIACRRLFGEDRSKFSEQRKLVHRACSQFHRQSQGFGMYGLDPRNFNLDEVVETGKMVITDIKVKKEIPIPMYYSRKLFSIKVKGEDGHDFWIPSELGKKYRSRRSYTSVKNVSVRFENWYKNLSVEHRQFVDDILEGRDFTDLATYMVFFKGRIIDFDNDELRYTFDTDFVIDKINEFDPISGEFKYEVIGDSVVKYKGEYIADLKEFSEFNVINDSYFADMTFAGFDSLISFYNLTVKPMFMEKQKVYEKKETLREIMRGFRRNLQKLSE